MMNKTVFYWTLSLAALILLNACDNTLNLVEPGGDVSVVYGLISSVDDEQFIRVERGFIDPIIPASEIVQNEDSIYYKNATVRLINLTTQTSFELEKIEASSLGKIREDGFFPTTPNYIYYRKGSKFDFRPGNKIRFELDKGDESDIVFSEITLLDSLLISSPVSGKEINIPTQTDYRVQWAASKNNPPIMYDINYIIHYEEANLLDPEPEFEEKIITWNLGQVEEENSLAVKGIDFYKFMGSALSKDPNIVRQF